MMQMRITDERIRRHRIQLPCFGHGHDEPHPSFHLHSRRYFKVLCLFFLVICSELNDPSFEKNEIELKIRMEKVNWKSSSSQAKLVGTIASILGAFVVTLYKGPLIFSPSSPPASVQPGLLSQQSNWILGGFLLAAEAFLISLAYIVQAIILKDYPVVLNIMFYGMFFQTIFSGLLSFVTVREPQSWILKVDLGLIAILYSALVANVFRITLSTWCLKRTGPVYVSMFQPLGTVFAVGLGFIFLGEKLHIGSLIGAIVIVMGFYGVVWAKSKEEEKTIEGSGVEESLASSSDKIPLLRNKASRV
ncbi:hypothetical protein EUGRSUZ_B03946 [Eucalyptus grandis]|uniref:Uncharacterized protein n=2 Tax=Eucalyptus grandis TaxID=71139 RepID=A0ACC3LZ22_EUCGR|nr:hypothetical protein EUGRSUZ_B03946 [Eucalyptus grandis]